MNLLPQAFLDFVKDQIKSPVKEFDDLQAGSYYIYTVDIDKGYFIIMFTSGDEKLGNKLKFGILWKVN